MSTALESITKCMAVTAPDWGLVRANLQTTHAVISSVAGQNEVAKKMGKAVERLVEDDASYKLFGEVEDGQEALEPYLGVLLENGGTDNKANNKRVMKQTALHNNTVTIRNGVGLGYGYESGTGILTAPVLRGIMDLYKKEISGGEKLSDDAGVAEARRGLGEACAILGGRKQDSFDALEIALKYAKEKSDVKLQASVLRTLAELQEVSGELRNSSGSLKKYLKLAEEGGDLLSVLDALKKLMGVYCGISKTMKEMDSEATLGQEEYHEKTDEELEELEKDEQFMRGNSKLRAARYGKKLKEAGNYWEWSHVVEQKKCEEEEEAHMKTLTVTPAVPAVKKGGAAGAFGGAFGGGGAKKSFGTVFG
jgi:hypothetical protein